MTVLVYEGMYYTHSLRGIRCLLKVDVLDWWGWRKNQGGI